MKKPILQVLVPIAVIVAVILTALTFVKKNMSTDNHNHAAEVGAKLPDFEMHELGGKTKKISEFREKVLLINFWATWCEACLVEMPSLVALREKYQAKGFNVAFVTVDERPEIVVPSVLNEMGVKFQTYTDPGEKLAALFGVHAIPLTAIIDRDRKVLHIESGDRNWNSSAVHKMMDQWLGVQDFASEEELNWSPSKAVVTLLKALEGENREISISAALNASFGLVKP